jgi:hypothetical protein
MKRVFCIIALCSISSFMQASQGKSPLSKNPILLRADTLTGQIEHAKAQAQLLQAASNKSNNDTKIKMQVETQRSYERARNLAEQDAYNQTILTCNNALNAVVNKKVLESVRINLYQILSNKKSEDKPILDQLQAMDKNLEKRYCFVNPSARRIERSRVALYQVVNQRLIQINNENEIADDASSQSSSSVSSPALVQAVAVDPKTNHYRGWM